jgi:general secretion pathway protein M
VTPGSATLARPLDPLRTRWRSLGAREQRALLLAALVLGAFVLWTAAVQPAWRTLRSAPAERAALEQQLQQMQALAAEVQQLRDAPALSPQQASDALHAASAQLGSSARLSLQGDRAVLTLQGASPSQLREWLAQARSAARARPLEMQLTRGAQGLHGNIVLALGGGS